MSVQSPLAYKRLAADMVIVGQTHRHTASVLADAIRSRWEVP